MRIINCKVNHLTNPVGFAMDIPLFSWIVEDVVGTYQEYARITVRTKDAMVLDTGWSKELDSLGTLLAIPLLPAQRYFWSVIVLTNRGEEVRSSENYFETGLMDLPWEGQWIGCDSTQSRHPVFSKEITVTKPVESARLYICGLGLYEASWNGEKIGQEYMAPYCNNYDSWLQYQTYDLTHLLQFSGTLSVLLGNGWYKGRYTPFDDKQFYDRNWRLIAQVCIRYADGTQQIVGTDESWNVTRSNICFSGIYDGEHRDDTLPATLIEPARLVSAPKGKLTERYSVSVLPHEHLSVLKVITTPAGERVLDVGQNISGIFRFRIHEPRGTKVRLQFGEILQNGCFYRDNLRSAKAEYIYISDGAPHILEPKFTYYGYRYVKVEGISVLRQEDFTAVALYSELPLSGSITTGDSLINQLISNAQWGMRGNFLDVPTDCPQRDERLGWTGDAQVFCATACFSRDCYAFYRKFLHDLHTEQAPHHGGVPAFVPSWGHTWFSAAWGDAACIIPWTVYTFYGDKTILKEQFDSMRGWVDFITRMDYNDHEWRTHFQYGDWLALDGPKSPEGNQGTVGGTDQGYIASIFHRHSALLTAKTARVLGKEAEAVRYEGLAQRLAEEIRADYFSESGECLVDTQTGLLLALWSGLAVNPALTVKRLGEKLEANQYMLQTGFVGTPLLCPVLTSIGRSDLAFRLLHNQEYPGWLYSIKLGATTIWERWNSVLPDGSISSTSMNSLNHYAYGSILEWLYRDVAGIEPMSPGFRRVRLAPHMDKKLGSLRAEYRSNAGTYQVQWELSPAGDYHYQCTIPFNCEAELYLPDKHLRLGPGTFEFHVYQTRSDFYG